MLRFNNDYSEGAHPKVLEKLVQTNLEQTAPYGQDLYCLKAELLIKEKCKNLNADVHFLVGGTQTNLTFISSALRPHQAVISADSGHIHTHETGAIEAIGHKVMTLPSKNGKLTSIQIKNLCEEHYNDVNREHITQPKLVYLTNPTELGTIYSKSELVEISEVCKNNELILYMDGARLGFALAAQNNDLNLSDIAELCDAFYIGGTKIGALFGEALVICKDALKCDFRYIMKQKGALLAKGRLLGLQFLSLFEDDLYLEISKHVNGLAKMIEDACRKKGYEFLIPSLTNQQFPIIPNVTLDKLKEKYEYLIIEKVDSDKTAIRFCTSWATQIDAVNQLINDILEF